MFLTTSSDELRTTNYEPRHNVRIVIINGAQSHTERLTSACVAFPQGIVIVNLGLIPGYVETSDAAGANDTPLALVIEAHEQVNNAFRLLDLLRGLPEKPAADCQVARYQPQRGPRQTDVEVTASPGRRSTQRLATSPHTRPHAPHVGATQRYLFETAGSAAP